MAVDLKGKKLPKGILQRSNGLYCGRFKYEGQQYVFYDRDLEQLKKTLEDKKYEVRHGIFAKEENITIDSWFHTWMTEYKRDLKENTVQTYEQVYSSYIKPEFGKRKLKDIRPEMIQALINRLFSEGKSRSRVNIAYVIFLGMYKKAVVLKLVKDNPTDAVEFPKNKCKKEMRVMTLAEQETFIKYAAGSSYYDVYMMALCTGMRIGEILALRWNDVDFANKTISVNGTLVYIRKESKRFIDTPKSSKSIRKIPMLEKLERLLRKRSIRQKECRLLMGKEWKEEPGLENLVFTYETGGAFWDTAIRVEMNKIIDTINADGIEFKKITPHTFRHTFATRGLEKDIPPKVMQELLGHSSLAMTMDKYSHVLPDMKAREMEKMRALF